MSIPPASAWLRRFSEDHYVILGSSSKWRRSVLESAGCRIVEAIDPAIDEKAIRDVNPDTLVLAISNAKADAILAKLAHSGENAGEKFLICTDQVAVCEGTIREKPESESQAREFIKSYSEGKSVSTCSGVVVVELSSGKRVSGTFYNEIKFNPIPANVVDEIARDDLVYTCCGGFTVDLAPMNEYLLSIEGGMDGVMGMPLGLLEKLFKQLQLHR